VNLFGDRWTFLQVNGFFWVLLGLTARGLENTRQGQVLDAADSFGTEQLASELAMDAETSCA
jgi:hypothetical protein